MPRSAMTLRASSPPSIGRLPAFSPPRSRAATAIASSSSGLGSGQKPVTERLLIARLGARGEGIAETPAGPLYVAYALPGETAEVDAWPGHPDRRHLIRIAAASPERIAPI